MNAGMQQSSFSTNVGSRQYARNGWESASAGMHRTRSSDWYEICLREEEEEELQERARKLEEDTALGGTPIRGKHSSFSRGNSFDRKLEEYVNLSANSSLKGEMKIPAKGKSLSRRSSFDRKSEESVDFSPNPSSKGEMKFTPKGSASFGRRNSFGRKFGESVDLSPSSSSKGEFKITSNGTSFSTRNSFDRKFEESVHFSPSSAFKGEIKQDNNSETGWLRESLVRGDAADAAQRNFPNVQRNADSSRGEGLLFTPWNALQSAGSSNANHGPLSAPRPRSLVQQFDRMSGDSRDGMKHENFRASMAGGRHGRQAGRGGSGRRGNNAIGNEENWRSERRTPGESWEGSLRPERLWASMAGGGAGPGRRVLNAAETQDEENWTSRKSKEGGVRGEGLLESLAGGRDGIERRVINAIDTEDGHTRRSESKEGNVRSEGLRVSIPGGRQENRGAPARRVGNAVDTENSDYLRPERSNDGGVRSEGFRESISGGRGRSGRRAIHSNNIEDAENWRPGKSKEGGMPEGLRESRAGAQGVTATENWSPEPEKRKEAGVRSEGFREYIVDGRDLPAAENRTPDMKKGLVVRPEGFRKPISSGRGGSAAENWRSDRSKDSGLRGDRFLQSVSVGRGGPARRGINSVDSVTAEKWRPDRLQEAAISGRAGGVPPKEANNEKRDFVSSLELEFGPHPKGNVAIRPLYRGALEDGEEEILPHIVGTCPDMCPGKFLPPLSITSSIHCTASEISCLTTFNILACNLTTADILEKSCESLMNISTARERLQRERLRDLAVFERISGDLRKTSKELAVKKFCRTVMASELEQSDVRPLPVLWRTLQYLLRLLDDPEFSFDIVHDFLFDRTRAIRQELGMQRILDHQTITMHEEIVRFHILSEHELREQNRKRSKKFDTHLNLQQLSKSLYSLLNLYISLGGDGVHFENETEFYAYYVLLNLGNHGRFQAEPLALWFPNVPSHVLQGGSMQFARKALRFYRSNNFVGFFRLVREATYLQSCLLELNFHSVRATTLAMLNVAEYKLHPFPFSDLAQLLILEENEVEELCMYYGLLTGMENSTQKRCLLVKQAQFATPERELLPQYSCPLIDSKRALSYFLEVKGGTIKAR